MPSSMPVPVTTHADPTPSTIKVSKSNSHKKTRIVRRRGRAKHDIDSDEEIEREAVTDSDTDSALDSDDSDSSDTEPASEDVAHITNPRVATPGADRTQEDFNSSIKVEDEAASVSQDPSFFAPSGNWSEMVADENANGPSDLPVIDFTDFKAETSTEPTKPRKQSKKARSAASAAPIHVSAPHEDEQSSHELEEEEPPKASTSRSTQNEYVRRPPGQTAKQAYQQRLENDPSFVPFVGEFWGHDDRLMDKGLRSLSGWWRGKWQGRGARGRGGLVRGRGRGGFSPGPPTHSANDGEAALEPTAEIPSVDKPWTHDGFEEMKRREEQRRAIQAQRGNGRGGSFVPPRGSRGTGRGGTFGLNRASFAPPAGRIWFAMKPERMWTKQADGYLHNDTFKSRLGQPHVIRVKLSGSQAHAVRPSRELSKPTTSTPKIIVAPGEIEGEAAIVVRIPKRPTHSKPITPPTPPEEEAQKIVAAEVEDAFTVKPRLVSPALIPIYEPATAPSLQGSVKSSERPLPPPEIVQQLERLSIEPQGDDPARLAQTEQAVLRQPLDAIETDQQTSSSTTEDRPFLPPIQTVFAPPPPLQQPTPPYGSPFAYAQAPLPHGIAYNHHGIPYEVSTGRPVYIHSHPPPPPGPMSMYDPRPVMHNDMARPPFMPSHMRHHSSMASSDFYAPMHSPSPPVHQGGYLDPSTRAPIFAMPRHSSRIEIRAPDGTQTDEMRSGSKTGSGLRSNATEFEPGRPTAATTSAYETMPTHYLAPYGMPAEGAYSPDPTNSGYMDPSVMGYAGYPPPAPQYYGNGYMEPYGYPQYAEPNGTVYYQ